MEPPTDPAKLKAQLAYNAASDHFDDEPLAFWARAGSRTVERLALPTGAAVLDVGCGTGASAIPAAIAVGPTGLVTGVDLADRLLDRAREKARQQGMFNVEFRQGDMEDLGYRDGEFDAVISVFSVFFVPDMTKQVAELWRMVKPGGAACDYHLGAARVGAGCDCLLGCGKGTCSAGFALRRFQSVGSRHDGRGRPRAADWRWRC
jgi:SAM-dependent methyltransferase